MTLAVFLVSSVLAFVFFEWFFRQPFVPSVGVKRKKRVRLHLVDAHPGSGLPSIEGLLVSKRQREYMVALPSLIVAENANPTELDSRWLVIPRERVAFYEVIG